MPPDAPAKPTVVFGRAAIGVDDVVAIADGSSEVALDADTGFRARLDAGAEVVRKRVAEGDSLYGVTTGFGDSVETSVPSQLAEELPLNLMRYHGCGTGPILSDRIAAAVLTVRLASLCRGFSGVRPVLLERLVKLINSGVLPRIPAQGSVGASGDLTPLSYVVATVVGEREVSYRGEVMPAEAALAAEGLAPLKLAPKESLALMNGTSVMTAIGCLLIDRARRFARFATAITSMAIDVMHCNRFHFDPRIGELKPHPGQQRCASWIRADIEYDARQDARTGRLQDRYSIRCAPHVIGVLLDAIEHARGILDVEINSVNDNPLVDPDRGDFVNGGNFYGGHVAFALDGLKTALANVAGLLDRQIALLCDARTNAGLPPNLVAGGSSRPAHHGFKAMQISASALSADALKLTMPASVFSRSTECHNQDIVSMGSHAAQDCLQIVDLCESVGAICALAVCQAVDLRDGEGCHARSKAMHAAVREAVPMVDADRRQDLDIARILEVYRAGDLPTGDLT